MRIFRLLMLALIIFVPHLSYANEGTSSYLKDTEFKSVSVWAKNNIDEVLSITNLKDVGECYKKISLKVEEVFDYKNLLNFALGKKNMKKLDEDQRGFFNDYGKRFVTLTFLERFFIKDLVYEIKDVRKNEANKYTVIIDIKSVEGLNIEGVFEEDKANKKSSDIGKATEVAFIIKKQADKYIIQDIKALNLSLLMSNKEYFQNKLKQENGDMNYLLDDLIVEQERREEKFRTKHNLSRDLFPPIKTLMILE